uniref:Uncharacterized protein n=1 Tax=Malurus cyaneus samueli TaxID=2593467 RepID=A0A8C5U964_9PASS
GHHCTHPCDLVQSQWWHRQLTEQAKVLLQQHRAEKDAEMQRCKNDLVKLKESFEQAQSDIAQWVRSCGAGRGCPRPGWPRRSGQFGVAGGA